MLYDWDDVSNVYVVGEVIDWEVLYATTPAPPPPQKSAFNDFFFGARERYADTSPKFNPTLRERQIREEEEILIL